MKAGLNVRIWMMQESITSRKIARDYGSTESFVSRFLNGERTSRPLADHFINSGCPQTNFKEGKVTA
ncbi:MAG: hypothetical protein MI862_22400 [Desulfobacterales bacterium]|nr:hypothetical protein [Desulfobacterales bacterium]